MGKFKLLFFIFLLSQLLFSQNTEIKYEMTYISDTIQKESISKIMSLYITPSKKIFIDSEKLSQKDNEEISLDYDYTTIRQENKLTKFYLIDSELFSTEEKIPSFDWKISNETKMIDNIKCQLATLNYKGRIWNAWFSPKYSFFSGPYIFDNLPGLIIEISDSKNHYNFKLIEINQKKYNIIIPKSLTVDSNSLKKLYLNYFENPFRKLKEKGILYSIDENGNKVSPPNFDLMVKSRQQFIFNNNNPIELSNAVKYNYR